jgi:hypothetical protein
LRQERGNENAAEKKKSLVVHPILLLLYNSFLLLRFLR